jgi:aspartokinase-like uncharacterized kinase
VTRPANVGPPVAVKVGGGLTAIPGALDAVCGVISAAGTRWPILVVPGGGPFADAVRAFDRQVGLSAEAAHWMAMLGMDQYAHVLAERIAGAVLVEEPGDITEALRTPAVAVLAPARWMRAADMLPYTWDVTSDSIAAFIAGAVDAERLILVKPVSGGTELLDPFFQTALPAGLPVAVVEWNRLCDHLG